MEILRHTGSDNVQKTKKLLKIITTSILIFVKFFQIDITPEAITTENVNSIGGLHLKQTFPKANDVEQGQYAMSLVQDIEKVRQSNLDQFSYKDW